MHALLRNVRAEPPRVAAQDSWYGPACRSSLRTTRAGAPGALIHPRRASRAVTPRGRDGAVRAGGVDPRPDQRTRVMVDLSLLPDGGASWLDASGDHADIVISTRIRLARNVEGYAFTPRARDGERLRVLSQVREAAQHLRPLAQGVLLRVDELPQLDRQLLHERHLVSKELAGFDGPHGVRTGAAVLLGEDVSVMVNEEDHLRLQALRSGFELPAAWRAVERLDQDLGGRVPYAFHGEFGFL